MDPISASEVFGDKPKFDANLIAMRAVLRFVHMDEPQLAEKLIQAAKQEFEYAEKKRPIAPYATRTIIASVWNIDRRIANPRPVLAQLADFALTLVSSSL